MGEDSASLILKGITRFIRGFPQNALLVQHACFQIIGSFFSCPEFRGQSITQAGLSKLSG